MAAGIVYHNITTASGVTFTIAAWVPDTSAPDVGAIPVSLPVNLSGVPLWRAEDAAFTTGDHLAPVGFVQQATPANDAADGDYANPKIDGGYTWVATPKLVKVSANFNRPGDTTAYSINDGVSDNTTAGSVTKLSWAAARSNGVVRRVRIRKSDQTVATPTIRLWLWDTTFTVGSGDNAAFANPLADTIGVVDVAVTNAGSDDAVGWVNCDIPFTTGTIYGLLQTLTAFTPANAETFTIDLWIEPR